ncbi:hypothetical protein QJQ45_020354 [Haematococcus lacustris]|nr:hypothetical protein QJQ45_020354 [Haematococcus lacustris]
MFDFAQKTPGFANRVLRHPRVRREVTYIEADVVHIEMEAAMAAWQLDMVPWQQAELTNPGLLPRPPRPPTPYALTPTSKCQARHVFIDTRGLYGMMHDAGMLGVLTEEGVTSLKKFRNGALPDPAVPGNFIAGPKDSHVANRWDALLPDPRRQKLASPKHNFAQIVHTDGVAISVMFLRPKPAAPPAELPRMGRGVDAVNPLAHLHAEWLGVDPGKTNQSSLPPCVAPPLPAQPCPTPFQPCPTPCQPCVAPPLPSLPSPAPPPPRHAPPLPALPHPIPALCCPSPPCPALLHPLPALPHPLPALPHPTPSQPCPTPSQPCVAPPLPSLPSPAPPHPSPAPPHPSLALPLPSPPCPALPHPIPALPHPIPALPHPIQALPHPIQALRFPSLPCPALPVGVWQCSLQVAAGCRFAAVHVQQQQAAVHVLQCMSSSSSRLYQQTSPVQGELLPGDLIETNMATVAHEERSAAGTVVSVRHWKLTAGQYYRDSGITRQAQATKTWLAKVKPQLTALSRVSSKPSSLASYRRFANTVLATYDAMWAEVSKKRWANAKFRLYCGKMRVVASFWAKVKKQAQKRWPDRILALAYGAASFSGSGSIGCRGVPVSQMRKEAVKQFGAGRVVLVDEFRTSRVSSAYSHPIEQSSLPVTLPPPQRRQLLPAPVTTIVAASTEAAQADAAPASGAGSAHDAAVTPTAKQNPKRVRPPRTAKGQQEDTRGAELGAGQASYRLDCIEALPGQPPESFRWLRPVYSEAKRSQVRGLMSSTSYNIRFYDRDVSAALNIRRCAVGPGPRPTELCYWDGRPAMPKPGRPGQEWVYVRDKGLLRKWRRKWRQ